ncbi:MAG: helix-turn-helix transcriptional regulator [Candidatus Acidiferrum sp.]
MSLRSRNRAARASQPNARFFAALGDGTRLLLISKLCHGEPRSISQLTRGSRLTRQAITKHLRVLENAGVVRNIHTGRESLFEFDPQPMQQARQYLDQVSAEWGHALSRLKAFVER